MYKYLYQCVLTRAGLSTTHLSPSDRASTFDGPVRNSEIQNMHGDDLRDEVAEQLEWMIDHLSELLPYTHRIWAATLYFKMGLDGRLYFLWCAGLQFERTSTSGKADSMAGGANERLAAVRPRTPRCVENDPSSESGWQEKKEGQAGLGLWGGSGVNDGGKGAGMEGWVYVCACMHRW